METFPVQAAIYFRKKLKQLGAGAQQLINIISSGYILFLSIRKIWTWTSDSFKVSCGVSRNASDLLLVAWTLREFPACQQPLEGLFKDFSLHNLKSLDCIIELSSQSILQLYWKHSRILVEEIYSLHSNDARCMLNNANASFTNAVWKWSKQFRSFPIDLLRILSQQTNDSCVPEFISERITQLNFRSLPEAERERIWTRAFRMALRFHGQIESNETISDIETWLWDYWSENRIIAMNGGSDSVHKLRVLFKHAACLWSINND